MTTTQTLRGAATFSFWADDLQAAKAWYSELLGMEPYFARNGQDGALAYIEFRIGDYQHELGIIDSHYKFKGASSEMDGVVVYWHVDDVAATLERLKSMGATEAEPLTRYGEEGEGWVRAAVVDPFGNILGIMYNPHYVSILGEMKAR